MSLALILPLTSKKKKKYELNQEQEGGEYVVNLRLEELVLPKEDVNVYVVIDEDDPVYNSSSYTCETFESLFKVSFVDISIRRTKGIEGESFQPYKVYNQIIREKALPNKANEYFILWGDDILTENDNWLPIVKQYFDSFTKIDVLSLFIEKHSMQR